jgi:peptidyl-prolyl cis-trans isomerase SurA
MQCLVSPTGLMGSVSLLSITLALSAQDAPDDVIVDEIVARVNQDVVTKTDLDEDLRTLQIDLRDQYKDEVQFQEAFERAKRISLQEIIETRLMLQKAEDMGVGVEVEQDVDRYIQNLMDQNGIPNLQVLDQALQQRGTSLQEFRKSIRERMIVETVRQQLVYGRITLLTPEIEAYYQEHQEDFTETPQVTLSEIAIYEDKAQGEARTKAQEALDRLRGGDSFEELAKEHSEGATASRGGDIGTFKQGVLAASLESVVFDLEVGQNTGLIENEWGIQIIKVTAKETSTVKPLADVKNEITQRMYEQKALPELKKFIEDLIEKSYLYISPKYRDQFDLKDGI